MYLGTGQLVTSWFRTIVHLSSVRPQADSLSAVHTLHRLLNQWSALTRGNCSISANMLLVIWYLNKSLVPFPSYQNTVKKTKNRSSCSFNSNAFMQSHYTLAQSILARPQGRHCPVESGVFIRLRCGQSEVDWLMERRGYRLLDSCLHCWPVISVSQWRRHVCFFFFFNGLNVKKKSFKPAVAERFCSTDRPLTWGGWIQRYDRR